MPDHEDDSTVTGISPWTVVPSISNKNHLASLPHLLLNFLFQLCLAYQYL